jgi:hypothetical protein
VTVFVPNKTKEARDAFNKAELEVALEGMHAAKPEIYSEDIQDELGDKLLNFGEELRKQVLECTEPIDSSVIQKVENGLRDIREAKLLSTHNSQTRCRCGRQGSKHNLQIKSVESPLPTVDELRSAILEPLPSAEYVMPDLTAKEGRFKYLQDLASGKFDPLKVEEDVRVECKSGVRPSLMTEFDVKNEAKLFRAQHIVDDMVLRGLICGDEDSIQTQIDQIVSWPDEYVDTFEEGIKQFNGVKAGVFKKAE